MVGRRVVERGGADVARHAVLDGVGVELGGPAVEKQVVRPGFEEREAGGRGLRVLGGEAAGVAKHLEDGGLDVSVGGGVLQHRHHPQERRHWVGGEVDAEEERGGGGEGAGVGLVAALVGETQDDRGEVQVGFRACGDKAVKGDELDDSLVWEVALDRELTWAVTAVVLLGGGFGKGREHGGNGLGGALALDREVAQAVTAVVLLLGGTGKGREHSSDSLGWVLALDRELAWVVTAVFLLGGGFGKGREHGGDSLGGGVVEQRDMQGGVPPLVLLLGGAGVFPQCGDHFGPGFGPGLLVVLQAGRRV